MSETLTESRTNRGLSRDVKTLRAIRRTRRSWIRNGSDVSELDAEIAELVARLEAAGFGGR